MTYRIIVNYMSHYYSRLILLKFAFYYQKNVVLCGKENL